jgi:protein TonB
LCNERSDHSSSVSPQVQQRRPSRRTIGWAVVVLVHIFVGWALVSGTAPQGLEIIKKPLEAAVIQEVIIPAAAPAPAQGNQAARAQGAEGEAPAAALRAAPEVTPPPSAAPPHPIRPIPAAWPRP